MTVSADSAGRIQRRGLNLEPLEQRIHLDADIESGLLPFFYDGPESGVIEVQMDAMDDATDEFSWTGWADQGDGSGLLSAEMSFVFDNAPIVDNSSELTQIIMEGEQSWVSEGDPIVPVRVATILLPQGSEITSVQVTLGEGTTIFSSISLPASPTVLPFGEEGVAAEVTAAPSFPDNSGVVYSTQCVAGYSIGVLRLFPAHYDASAETITYYSDISVSVTTEHLGDWGGVGARVSADDLDRVAEMVDNDSALDGYTFETPADRGRSGALPESGRSRPAS